MSDFVVRNLGVLVIVVVVLALSLAIVPLAARGASRTVWRVHALFVLVAASALAVLAYRTVFAGVVPWTTVACVYAVEICFPLWLASWSARAAVRRWPQARWGVSTLATAGVLVGGFALGVGVSQAVVPPMVRAVR